MLRSWRYWGLLLTTVPAFGASAEEIGGKLRSVIQAHDPGAQVSAPERSPVSGLFQTSIDGVSGYVSADGRYFVVGDMLDLQSRRNVTEEGRKERRRELVRKVAPGEAIEFGAAKAKHTQYALGQELGVPGTPMIVMSDGTSLGGYMAPERLVAALEDHARERLQGPSAKSHEQ